MKTLLRTAATLNRALAFVGALAVVAMMLHITLDVVLRNLFRTSLNTAPEIVARYYMVGIAFLPLAWVEQRRDMISVELVDFAMTPLWRRISDLSVMLAAMVIYGLLAWATWPKAIKEAKAGALVELGTLKMPIWHSYFLPPVGFTLAAFACAVSLLVLLRPAHEPRWFGSVHGR
jgi:TRAP-type C4-dicarboxylate transport system permease small subunit